jgi:hypothetical protein
MAVTIASPLLSFAWGINPTKELGSEVGVIQ